jgi:hypothetical protein
MFAPGDNYQVDAYSLVCTVLVIPVACRLIFLVTWNARRARAGTEPWLAVPESRLRDWEIERESAALRITYWTFEILMLVMLVAVALHGMLLAGCLFVVWAALSVWGRRQIRACGRRALASDSALHGQS